MIIATVLLLMIFILAGILCIGAAIAGWEWFFTSANSLFGLIPRRGARPLAAILGIAVLAMAAIIFHDTFPSLF